jgi:TusA-related sulfurtransferase
MTLFIIVDIYSAEVIEVLNENKYTLEQAEAWCEENEHKYWSGLRMTKVEL